MQVYGMDRLAKMMEQTCELAKYFATCIEQSSELELLAPVNLNIVCFRYRCDDADQVNEKIVVAIQESGIAAPSSTIVGGQFAIRAAIFNHRTSQLEIDSLLEASLRFGRSFSQGSQF